MPERTPAALPDAHAALAQAGLRPTPPRLAIWQVLHEANDEPDAADVLRRAQSLEPRTSLGTVYRFLRELELLGLATATPVTHGCARWRLARPGEMTVPVGEPALQAIEKLASAFGYRLVRPRAHHPTT